MAVFLNIHPALEYGLDSALTGYLARDKLASSAAGDQGARRDKSDAPHSPSNTHGTCQRAANNLAHKEPRVLCEDVRPFVNAPSFLDASFFEESYE